MVFFVAFDILYTFPLLYGLHVSQLDIFQDCGSGACYNFPIWNKNDEAASIIYPFLRLDLSAIFQPYLVSLSLKSESQKNFGAFLLIFHGWLFSFELTISLGKKSSHCFWSLFYENENLPISQRLFHFDKAKSCT